MLSLARVVNVHPESHAVDVVLMDDGRRIPGVQVLSGSAGSNFGFADLAMPDATGYSAKNTKTRDIYAVLSWVRDHPVVLGFLFPQVAQCLFADKERMVYRHASDVYVTIDKSGNTEVAHPSGAFLRIGTTPGHEDLTGKDYDKVWKIARNTDKAVHIHVEQAGGKASVDIAPSGAIKVDTVSTVDANAAGHIKANSDALIELTAPSIVLNGNTLINGPLSQGTGSAGGAATMNGPVTVSNDMTAGGISLMGHTHTEQGDGAEVSTPH